MSDDPFSIAVLHPEENVPYTPSPLGARIVHSLVNINYLPDPLPSGLPKPWRIAIESVRKVREKDQYTRWRAFMEATKNFPYSMIQEVNAYNGFQVVDRAEKDRILYRLKDVIQPPPPREWVVDGILSRSSLNLLVGNPGSKKTYMAVDLAMCVAMGKPWLGRPVGTRGIPSPAVGATHESPEPSRGGVPPPPASESGESLLGKSRVDSPALRSNAGVRGLSVLFVDEETGFQQLWPRLHAAIQGHHTDEGPPFYFTTLAGYDLRSDKDAKMLIDRCINLNVGLVVIDALADLMNTAENSVASVQAVLFNLRRIADFTRAAVLVIHHTNRRGFFRGSSAIAASMDLMLSIDSSPNDSYIEFRTVKARFSSPKPFAANAIFSTTDAGVPTIHLEPTDLRPEYHSPLSLTEGEGSGVRANPRPGITQTILAFLSSNPNASREQIFAHCSSHKEGSVKNALYDLIEEKKVIRTNEGSNGKQASYSLSSNRLV